MYYYFVFALFVTSANGYWYPICGQGGCSSFPKFPLIEFQPKKEITHTNSLTNIAANGVFTFLDPVSCLYNAKIDPVVITLIEFIQTNIISFLKKEQEKNAFSDYYYLTILGFLTVYLILYIIFIRKLINSYRSHLKSKYRKNYNDFILRNKQ